MKATKEIQLHSQKRLEQNLEAKPAQQPGAVVNGDGFAIVSSSGFAIVSSSGFAIVSPSGFAIV